MDHISAITAQISQLEADLRANPDPREVALQHLKAAIMALGQMSGAQNSTNRVRATLPSSSFLSVPKSPRADSKIARIDEFVGTFLDKHGSSHRSLIIQGLTEAGLMEGIKDPTSAFATSMHTLKHRYVSDGKGNFRRVTQVDPEPANTQITDEVLHSLFSGGPPLAKPHTGRPTLTAPTQSGSA